MDHATELARAFIQPNLVWIRREGMMWKNGSILFSIEAHSDSGTRWGFANLCTSPKRVIEETGVWAGMGNQWQNQLSDPVKPVGVRRTGHHWHQMDNGIGGYLSVDYRLVSRDLRY